MFVFMALLSLILNRYGRFDAPCCGKFILSGQGVQQLNVIVIKLTSASLESSDIVAFDFIFKARFALLKSERSDYFQI